jgi:hypothetical protein
MTLRAKRGLALLGMFMVADGSTALINPAGWMRLWSGPRAPGWYRDMTSYFTKHLRLTRALSIAELAGGLALVARSSASA